MIKDILYFVGLVICFIEAYLIGFPCGWFVASGFKDISLLYILPYGLIGVGVGSLPLYFSFKTK